MHPGVKLDEEFYIVADTERPATPLRVLKHGDSFAVFDAHGDLVPADGSEQGLYHDGTRFLSRLELLFGRHRPLLLSSTISADNAVFTADSTNPDVRRGDRLLVARGEIHVFRTRVVRDGGLLERIRVSNYAAHSIEAPLSIRFDGDFADMFEVRGTRRARRGERLPDTVGQSCLLRYCGLDDVERRTHLNWSRTPDSAERGMVTFLLSLPPRASADIELSVACEIEGRSRLTGSFDAAVATTRQRLAARTQRGCHVTTSNESFNQWIARSTADLQMMITETPHGLYPYAGIPWFNTPFGRDGLITALELLWADPEVAHGVLAFLAGTQATTTSDAQDAQPGKILHEMRGGEMAALGEIPFGRYYGTADATPLFVMLAHAYFERTGDVAFIDRLWPHIVSALGWMAEGGDPDHDSFIEYSRRGLTGLVHQGWKDSDDSVFHADATPAEPPIALAEVQGYAYAAWLGAGRLASMRGDDLAAAEWHGRAERLRARFDEAFWCEELGTYALALDGLKRPCRVRTSNPGHCLFTGIASIARARRVAATLMADSSFGGWGVRTLDAGEPRYNPMSYHNGSIWPHDNALIAAGLARYGLTDEATRIMTAMFDLSQVVDLHRLPELICGFHRRGTEHPTLYPVACAPQAWAAGAVYLLLQSCLGLSIDVVSRRVTFGRASLPHSVKWLQISNLTVGNASIDLMLERHAFDVSVTVLRRHGDIEIVASK
jgi:glycogen debranching enzyme